MNKKFDDRLNQIVIGTILGDGYLTKSGSLQIDHSTIQKNYVDWKYKELGDFAGKPPTTIKRVHKKTNKESFSYRFYTKSKFKDLRLLFYPNGKKEVPKNINELLVSDIALAVWFRDDGGKSGNTPYGLVISVAGFSKEEQFLLQTCLLNNYGLNVTIWKNNQIYIPKSEYALFYSIVSPFILPDLMYKLYITP